MFICKDAIAYLLLTLFSFPVSFVHIEVMTQLFHAYPYCHIHINITCKIYSAMSLDKRKLFLQNVWYTSVVGFWCAYPVTVFFF